MMRAFYITAVVFTVIFIILSLVYMERVHAARMASYYNSYDSYSYSSYSSYDYSHEITREMGFISAFFFMVYLVVEILTFIKLKTKTMTVLNIIGICFTGIMLIWNALMISSPGGLSFDEVGPAWLLFGIIQLAFCIVGMIHAFKKKV
jgi:hypothetical protein